MSAPNTNLEKQRRRHRGPLIGMVAVIVFAGAILLVWLWYEFSLAENPSTTVVDPLEASQSVGAADEGSIPAVVDPLRPPVTPPEPVVPATPDAIVPLSPDAPAPQAADPLDPAAPAPAPVE